MFKKSLYFLLPVLLSPFIQSAYAVDPYWLKRVDAKLTVQDDLSKIEGLVNQRQFAEAYRLLAPLALRQAKNPQFLYLFGTSAFGSQRYAEAKRLFVRAERLAPKRADIQLGLGMSYLYLNEIAPARQHLEHVFSLNPSPDVAQAAERSLRAIYDFQQQALLANAPVNRASLSGSVSMELGASDNANSAMNADTVKLPAYNNISLSVDPSYQAKSDVFANTSVGLQVQQRVHDHWAWQLGLSGSLQRFNKLHRLNNESVNLSPAVLYKSQSVSHSLSLNLMHYENNNLVRTNSAGLALRSSFMVNDRFYWYGSGSLGAVRYNKAYEVSDLNQLFLSFGGVLQGPRGVNYEGSFYLGRELCANEICRMDGNATLFGSALVSDYWLKENLKLYGSLAYKRTRYGGHNVYILSERSDHQVDGAMGLVWYASPNWSILPALSYSKIDSNYDANSYQRSMVTVNSTLAF